MNHVSKLAAIGLISIAGAAFSAGLPLSIEPVNTEALPDVGEAWLTENPYRDVGVDVWKEAIEIGSSGYNQNCARCHGLGVVSGGLAPDLRYLEAEEDGDEWFVERFQTGYTQGGTTKMPAFGDLLGQKAAWAIRTYIETRPDEDSLAEHTERLKEIRDILVGGQAGDIPALQAELLEIGAKVETASGAPIADSVALQAAVLLANASPDIVHAAEVLTIGLSAAQ